MLVAMANEVDKLKAIRRKRRNRLFQSQNITIYKKLFCLVYILITIFKAILWICKYFSWYLRHITTFFVQKTSSKMTKKLKNFAKKLKDLLKNSKLRGLRASVSLQKNGPKKPALGTTHGLLRKGEQGILCNSDHTWPLACLAKSVAETRAG